MPKDTDGLAWPADTVGEQFWEDFPRADAPTRPTFDIGRFYDGDPRRRQSEEVDLGKSWTGADETNYLLSWVHDTGELYLMRDMVALRARFGVRNAYLQAQALPDAVIILATIEGRDQLDAVLAGWAAAMNQPRSVTWLCAKLSDAGLLEHDLRTAPISSAGEPARESRFEPDTNHPGSPVADVGPTSGLLVRLKRLLGHS